MIENKIDLRNVNPKDHHGLLFRAFDELKSGESFTFLKARDPRPFFAQFEIERPQEFSWIYLEQGPQLWWVRIGRIDNPVAGRQEDGCCGVCH